jgi:hypothetical protein
MSFGPYKLLDVLPEGNSLDIMVARHKAVARLQ